MAIVKKGIEGLLYPWMEKHRGNRVRQYLAQLKQSEHYTAEQLHQQQEQALRQLLRHALSTVPAYRQYEYLLQDGDDWDARAVLQALPALTKDEFMVAPEQYISSKAERDKLIPGSSDDMGGHQLRFYLDRTAVEHYEAARWRGLARFGITPGSSSVMIWGSPIELNAAKATGYRLRERWLKNRIIIPADHIEEKSLTEHIRRIDRFKPEYLYGYSTALTELAQYMLAANLRLKNPLKAVVSTAEILLDKQRELMAQVFGCPVVNEYGARDGGIIAYDCPQGKLHINSENVLVEVVDPRSCRLLPAGAEGALLVTDLYNYSQPRLRYRLEDVVACSNRPCACGLELLQLDHVAGREDSMLVCADDMLVQGYAFSYAARLYGTVRDFRIIQHSTDAATLRLVMDKSAIGWEEDAAAFIRRCETLLPGTAIMAIYCDSIPLAESGKRRYSQREFPLNRYTPVALGEDVCI